MTPPTGGRGEPERSGVDAAQRLASRVRPGPRPDQTGEAGARRTSFQVPELLGKDGGRGSRRAKQTRSPCFSAVTARDAPDSGPGGGERAPRRPAAIRRRSGRDLAPSSAASGAPGPAAREPPPEVGSGLGPAPLRPRRPPETAATPARDSHVRVPPEGVGDVLHHPLHQHRHLLARLGHVGGRAARARLRDSAARPAGFRGERACAPVWRSSRLRPCRRRGRRELPGRPPVAGAWRPPGPERPGGSGPDVLSWSLTVGQRPGRCCRLSGRSRSYTFHSHFYPVGAAE